MSPVHMKLQQIALIVAVAYYIYTEPFVQGLQTFQNLIN